eukprot:comp12775_c0_seq1/m.7903 comp12775_c0_seq1/g.7903  ORF comp12775_c0_seq1/g.7903 comp12775_c0_seq1/m.7903 type:complete len:388 (-) comp12775_c0_seq1:145-1308(-)
MSANAKVAPVVTKAAMLTRKVSLSSMNPEEKALYEQYMNSKKIDEELAREKDRRKRERRLLVLGSADSGKSTFIKQMKIIYGNGYTKEELQAQRKNVYRNVMTSFEVIEGAMRQFGLTCGTPEDDQILQQLRTHAEELRLDSPLNGLDVSDAEFTDHWMPNLVRLWATDGVQEAVRRGSEVALMDSAAYFFSNLVRIGHKDYVPTEADVLKIRIATTGIHESQFNIDKLVYRFIDVAGQKSERRKWIHYFEDATAVVFFAALSSYDQMMAENGKKNRMEDALELFGQLVNNRVFERVSFILFLNKKDIFKEKLKKKPITTVFPEYTGDGGYKDTSSYIRDQFLAQNQTDKAVYSHFTCATDTEAIKKVFSDVHDILIRNSLTSAGLL